MRRATAAWSSRTSKDVTRPAWPTARSSPQVSAPEPAPASTTWRPGKTSAATRTAAMSLGYMTVAARPVRTTTSASRGRSTR